jgi:hypothetical protein
MNPDCLCDWAGGDTDAERNWRRSCFFDERVTVHDTQVIVVTSAVSASMMSSAALDGRSGCSLRPEGLAGDDRIAFTEPACSPAAYQEEP